jgi:hypothetical protein
MSKKMIPHILNFRLKRIKPSITFKVNNLSIKILNLIIMKKTFTFLAAVLISITVSAQIDLSGSWKLNSSKSKLGEQFSMAPKEIIVVQKGNNLSVERHLEWQGQEFTTNDKFTLDGKECINAGMMDTQKKSTVVWAPDKKSLKITSKIPMQDGGEISITEVYKMDGANMVIEMNSTSSFGDMAETQVYDKK